MDLGTTRIIVNPRAGRGAMRARWPKIAEALDALGVAHETVFTEHPGHAEQLARAAVAEGRRFITAVGGDGTVHEVVNGLMGVDEPRARGIVLGVLPSGSGCDFVKTFGIAQDPIEAAKHLAGDRVWGMLDVGRVRYRDESGNEHARWFINIAEAGIGARVVVTASRMPRALGGLTYRLAAMKAVLTFKPRAARISVNGRKARGEKTQAPFRAIDHSGTVTMVVVANCQFFGGGLRVAPRAIPSDQMFDVLVGEGTKWDAVRALRKMPTGVHVPDPTITEYLADEIEIGGDEVLMVEADGEPLGTTPARFDLVREAIALKI